MTNRRSPALTMSPSLKAMRSIYPLTRGRMSTAPMAAIRPVNSSHWRTDLVTTSAASTSGGGGGESAWLLLQAVMTVAMTTMATAERPARSDASKKRRYGTSVLLTGNDTQVEVNFNFENSR